MKLQDLWPFYAGILAQAVFLLIGQFERSDITRLLGCCGGSSIGLIPGKREHHYDLSFHLLMTACIFSVAYAICFKQKILERINKEILMVWTLVGLYVALQTPLITTHPMAVILLSALCIIPVANAFASLDKSYGWKVYFYVWFLCVLVGIAASKFAFSTVADVFQFHRASEELNAITTFFVGMSFLYLATNLWYVIELIPLPGKHESFSERLEHVKEDMEILADDYEEAQVRWWKTVLLLAVSASLLTVNYFQHFVSDETLIPLLIVFLPVVDKIKLPAKVPAQTVANPDTRINANE